MPLVERVAAQQVFAQRACCPDAELRAARGVDAVAYGDDGVEAVESQGLVGRSNVHFLHIALGRQLVVGQRPLDVPDITDRSRPNSSAICFCVSQTDSCSTRTSRLTSPLGELSGTPSPPLCSGVS